MSEPIITTAGRAYLAAHTVTNDVDIDRFIFANIAGLDPALAADPDQALPIIGDRVRTLAPTHSGYITDDKIVFAVILGTDEGDYTFNWVGLVASDDTLISVRTVQPVTKIQTVGNDLGTSESHSFIINYTNAAAIANISIAAESWMIDIGQATETVPGLSKIAPQTLVDAGDNHLSFVTAKTLKSRLGDFVRAATETVAGFLKIATQDQTDTGTDDATAITPKKLTARLGGFVRNATTAVAGMLPIATQLQTDTGTNDATIITPKKLASRLLDFVRNASTTIKGMVELATSTETRNASDTGRVVTPGGLGDSFINDLISTDARRGLSAAQGKALKDIIDSLAASDVGAEAAFAKATAFNKSFGAGASNVAPGNHAHTATNSVAGLTKKPRLVATGGGHVFEEEDTGFKIQIVAIPVNNVNLTVLTSIGLTVWPEGFSVFLGMSLQWRRTGGTFNATNWSTSGGTTGNTGTLSGNDNGQAGTRTGTIYAIGFGY